MGDLLTISCFPHLDIFLHSTARHHTLVTAAVSTAPAVTFATVSCANGRIASCAGLTLVDDGSALASVC